MGAVPSGAVPLAVGDAFFHGGRILLQQLWDCSPHDSIATDHRLTALDVDGLYPGHLTFSVRNGRRQFESALDAIARLAPPHLLG